MTLLINSKSNQLYFCIHLDQGLVSTRLALKAVFTGSVSFFQQTTTHVTCQTIVNGVEWLRNLTDFTVMCLKLILRANHASCSITIHSQQSNRPMKASHYFCKLPCMTTKTEDCGKSERSPTSTPTWCFYFEFFPPHITIPFK